MHFILSVANQRLHLTLPDLQHQIKHTVLMYQKSTTKILTKQLHKCLKEDLRDPQSLQDQARIVELIRNIYKFATKSYLIFDQCLSVILQQLFSELKVSQQISLKMRVIAVAKALKEFRIISAEDQYQLKQQLRRRCARDQFQIAELANALKQCEDEQDIRHEFEPFERNFESYVHKYYGLDLNLRQNVKDVLFYLNRFNVKYDFIGPLNQKINSPFLEYGLWFEEHMQAMVVTPQFSNSIRQKLQVILKSGAVKFPIRGVSAFGSCVNGFMDKQSDLDIIILTNCHVRQESCISQLNQAFKRIYPELELNSIIKTRVKVLNVKDNSRGQNIDIVINNLAGLYNSCLLRKYSEIDPQVKNFGIMLKLWAKARDLIDKTRMSSYAIILMMIHYLIKGGKVPCIQKPNEPQGCLKVKFPNDKEGILQGYFKVPDDFVFKKINLYHQFKGFLQFYSRFSQQTYPNRISINGNQFTEVNSELIISIQDPFDKSYDPGRLKRNSENLKIYKSAFEGTLRRLQNLQRNQIAKLFKKSQKN